MVSRIVVPSTQKSVREYNDFDLKYYFNFFSSICVLVARLFFQQILQKYSADCCKGQNWGYLKFAKVSKNVKASPKDVLFLFSQVSHRWLLPNGGFLGWWGAARCLCQAQQDGGDGPGGSPVRGVRAEPK